MWQGFGFMTLIVALTGKDSVESVKLEIKKQKNAILCWNMLLPKIKLYEMLSLYCVPFTGVLIGEEKILEGNYFEYLTSKRKKIY